MAVVGLESDRVLGPNKTAHCAGSRNEHVNGDTDSDMAKYNAVSEALSFSRLVPQASSWWLPEGGAWG